LHIKTNSIRASSLAYPQLVHLRVLCTKAVLVFFIAAQEIVVPPLRRNRILNRMREENDAKRLASDSIEVYKLTF